MTELSDKMMQKIQKHLRKFEDIWTLLINLVEDCIKELFDIAAAIDKFHKGATIASVTGNSIGIAGGITTIVGLALAPVTFGGSVIVSSVGIGVATLGGVTGAAASIADTVNITNKCKRVEEIVAGINKNFGCIQKISENIKWELEAIKSELDVQEEIGIQIGKGSGRGTFLAIEINRLIQLGKVSAAASRGAKLLALVTTAGILAAVFILIDTVFTVKGAIDLHKGGKTKEAAEIRKIAENLQKTLSSLKTEDAVLKKENEKFIQMMNSTEGDSDSANLLNSYYAFDSFVNGKLPNKY